MDTWSLKIRAQIWYGTFFLFLEQIAPFWRHISAHSRVDVVKLPDQNCEFGDSLADFSLRWQGIRQGIRSRALTCSCMPWANGKGEFFQGRKQFCALNEYDLLACSEVECVSFCLRSWKLWKKTVYSGIELIWEFFKQCLTITKTYFW